jgi:hypothetical protein
MLDLSQSEADALLAVEKRRVNDNLHPFTAMQGKVEIPLQSADGREQFLLDMSRGRINLLKGTYQNRGRQTVILARVDFGGAPHRNPDGVEMPCPHLHRYREGFGDKWAQPLPPEFGSSDDLWNLLERFLEYCNVTEPPLFDRELFQ